jgi:hypothetical protein
MAEPGCRDGIRTAPASAPKASRPAFAAAAPAAPVAARAPKSFSSPLAGLMASAPKAATPVTTIEREELQEGRRPSKSIRPHAEDAIDNEDSINNYMPD